MIPAVLSYLLISLPAKFLGRYMTVSLKRLDKMIYMVKSNAPRDFSIGYSVSFSSSQLRCIRYSAK